MLFLLILFFILGSAIGSFLNVVIDRTTRSETLLGRSYCDHCKAKLSTFDLVPILSFVGLRARCRYCRKKISLQYPAVEALTGFLFAGAFYTLASKGQIGIWGLALYLFLICIVVVVAVVDLKFSLIPTSFVFAASLVVLFYNYFALASSAFVLNIFAGFVLAFLFFLIVVITRGRGMGTGDIPLVFLIGLILGPKGSVLAMFAAFLTGAVVATVLVFLGKKKFTQTIPFGPFLVLGLIVALFWGDFLIPFYFSLLG